MNLGIRVRFLLMESWIRKFRTHVTISTNASTPAVYSNELLASKDHASVDQVQDLVLEGVVGVALTASRGSSVLTTRGDLLINTSSKAVPVSLNEDDDIIRSIYLFDFDGTLCDTPDAASGTWEYQRLTGKQWPHRGFAIKQRNSIFHTTSLQ